MPEAEARPQHNPEEELRGHGERSRWVVWTRDRFPEGSLGYNLFPSQLEDRSRPETVLNKALDESILLLDNRNRRILKRLNSGGIETADTILNLQRLDLDSFTKIKKVQNKIKDGLKHYLEDQLITPHGRLIEALCRQKQYPVPLEREQELIDVVDNKVNNLEFRVYTNFLRDRFGLDDGIYKTLPQISRLYRGLDRARSLESRIRHHRIVNDLYEYTTTPEESVARSAFDAVFYKELPHEVRGRSINLLDLSESAKEELPKIHRVFRLAGKVSNDDVVDVWELLQIDLGDAKVSQDAQEEISRKIRDYYDLHFTKPLTSY